MDTVDKTDIDFQLGERVFHVTNHFIRLLVVGIDDQMVECEWMTESGEVRRHKFHPSSLEKYSTTSTLQSGLRMRTI